MLQLYKLTIKHFPSDLAHNIHFREVYNIRMRTEHESTASKQPKSKIHRRQTVGIVEGVFPVWWPPLWN